METTPQQKTYTFAGIRWMPDYKDFDHDEVFIKASDPEEAYTLALKLYKNWQSIQLTHINDVAVDPPVTHL